MKIDSRTLSILKSFAEINPAIIVKEGNILTTKSPSKTIQAKAHIDTPFPKKFAIYNLLRFTSTISLFKEPDFEFNDKYVVIREGERKISYTYADEEMVSNANADRTIKLPNIDIQFTLAEETLKSVFSALRVLNLPEIVVAGDGENLIIEAVDNKNPTSDKYCVVLGSTDKKFRAIFRVENIKILPGDYQVEICKEGISHFKNDTCEYWITIEHDSKFNGV